MTKLRTGQPDVIWEAAEGCYVESKGTRYFDWTSGAITANAGHGCPQVKRYVEEALNTGVFHSYSFENPYSIKLSERLISVTGFDHCLFYSAGTEAIEAAVKLCKHSPISERPIILSFKDSFHGRSLGAQKIGAIESQKSWLEDDDSYIAITFPKCESSFRQMQSELEKIDLSQVLALFYEPFRGSRIDRPLLYAMEFLEKKRREYQFYVVCDEIQSGLYRTGKFLASSEYPIKNDFILLSKGLTSSLPLSVVLTNNFDQFNVDHGMITSSNGGNPISCAAALGSIDLLSVQCETKQFQKVCNSFQMHLNKIEECPGVEETFSWGLMGGIKLQGELMDEFMGSMLNENAIVFKPVGTEKKIKLCPPLTVTRKQLIEEFEKIRRVIGDLCNV